jgi:hypothetical protein
MFDFVFDLPLLVTGPALLLMLSLYAFFGLRLVRRRIHPRLTIHPGDSHFIGTMVHTVAVFYGLAVALITIAVWESYSDVTHVVSAEATAIGSLYRDLGGYPEPTRTQTRDQLKAYTEQVIEEAWPLMHKGQIPRGGVELMNRLQDVMLAFQPTTEAEKIIHAEAFRAFNTLSSARRMRLDAVHTALPSVLWFVVLAGAFIALATPFFFQVQDLRLHTTLVVMLAIFVGLVIFVILALDRPFRGDLGMTPEPYVLIHDHLMK